MGYALRVKLYACSPTNMLRGPRICGSGGAEECSHGWSEAEPVVKVEENSAPEGQRRLGVEARFLCPCRGNSLSSIFHGWSEAEPVVEVSQNSAQEGQRRLRIEIALPLPLLGQFVKFHFPRVERSGTRGESRRKSCPGGAAEAWRGSALPLPLPGQVLTFRFPRVALRSTRGYIPWLLRSRMPSITTSPLNLESRKASCDSVVTYFPCAAGCAALALSSSSFCAACWSGWGTGIQQLRGRAWSNFLVLSTCVSLGICVETRIATA